MSKTFSTFEDAKIFEFYKERLIENIDNFNIPIEKRIRLIDIIDMKKTMFKDPRAISELETGFKRCLKFLPAHTFLCELTFDDWHECMKKIATFPFPVKFGAKEKKPLSTMSIRRIFATTSAAFSHAISMGLSIENYPLKLIQTFLNPSIKSKYYEI